MTATAPSAIEAQPTDRLQRRWVSGEDPTVLPGIYDHDVNMVVWHRTLARELRASARQLIDLQPNLEISLITEPESASAGLENVLPAISHGPLTRDMAELADMFCCLFDLTRVGLRLTVLRRAMCPRFHVDHVPCRLVTTYEGEATEWLSADSACPGPGGLSLGRPAEGQSTAMHRSPELHKLAAGDVSLMKGEGWVGNEQGGLVHRSPDVASGAARLLLTLDFAR